MSKPWVVGAAGVVAVVAALAVGFAVGRWTAPDVVVPLPPPRSSSPPPPAEVRSATDPGTAVRITASVTPEDGWVRVRATVVGFPAGQPLRVVVVSRAGTRETAASWVGSAAGSLDGTTVDGAATVARADVVAVEVEGTDGRRYVSAVF
ncbi:hypothetical protein [Saccharothrix xinjiangensis]|uniref:Uncharacterized protein n=1 Tax=Saccharothrix xinjiangensis TaxID=204798 RepID=A0ABV9XVN1_9PSEU